MGAIRGAICVENTVEDIEQKAIELVNNILLKNELKSSDIEAVLFSATNDLDACYPARAVRIRFDMKNVAFMCFTEMMVKNSLDHCLRVCIITSKVSQDACKHCYLGRARQLRTDL